MRSLSVCVVLVALSVSASKASGDLLQTFLTPVAPVAVATAGDRVAWIEDARNGLSGGPPAARPMEASASTGQRLLPPPVALVRTIW